MALRYYISALLWTTVFSGNTDMGIDWLENRNSTTSATVATPTYPVTSSKEQSRITVGAVQNITASATVATPTYPVTSLKEQSRVTVTEGTVQNINTTEFKLVHTTDSCVAERFEDFNKCFSGLGENSLKHFETKNITSFLDDLCSPNVSKPYVECLRRHFEACPDLMNTLQVQMLEFGPYQITDVMMFYSVDHMCDCALGLVCVQEFNKIKQYSSFTRTYMESPLVRIPDYKAVCDKTIGKYIDCIRKDIRKCQAALYKRFNKEFTREHADEVTRLYDFRREYCDVVNWEGFDAQYKCVENLIITDEYKQCMKTSQIGPPKSQLCGERRCVHESMGLACNSSLTSLYIDAVNIYRHDQLKLLNLPCSYALNIVVSGVTLVLGIIIVLLI